MISPPISCPWSCTISFGSGSSMFTQALYVIGSIPKPQFALVLSEPRLTALCAFRSVGQNPVHNKCVIIILPSTVISYVKITCLFSYFFTTTTTHHHLPPPCKIKWCSQVNKVLLPYPAGRILTFLGVTKDHIPFCPEEKKKAKDASLIMQTVYCNTAKKMIIPISAINIPDTCLKAQVMHIHLPLEKCQCANIPSLFLGSC